MSTGNNEGRLGSSGCVRLETLKIAQIPFGRTEEPRNESGKRATEAERARGVRSGPGLSSRAVAQVGGRQAGKVSFTQQLWAKKGNAPRHGEPRPGRNLAVIPKTRLLRIELGKKLLLHGAQSFVVSLLCSCTLSPPDTPRLTASGSRSNSFAHSRLFVPGHPVLPHRRESVRLSERQRNAQDGNYR